VSPLYTPEDFLDSRVGTLPAINNPRTAALMVQRGHRDQLPSNYGVGRRVEPEAKFFNDFSRARACARAKGSVGSDSAMTAGHDGRSGRLGSIEQNAEAAAWLIAHAGRFASGVGLIPHMGNTRFQ
jgi:hypothetical protein